MCPLEPEFSLALPVQRAGFRRGGAPGRDWASSSFTLRAWGECAFECMCWESAPVWECVCVCVCVCTPKGRHVTRNMSEEHD